MLASMFHIMSAMAEFARQAGVVCTKAVRAWAAPAPEWWPTQRDDPAKIRAGQQMEDSRRTGIRTWEFGG